MARRENELFIGKEYLNLEGRTVKHPALINIYGTLNVNKLNDSPLKLIGLDLETNHLTSELKLLGFWIDGELRQYNSDFLHNLFNIIKWASYSDFNLAYWNNLDPQVLFKQFLKYATEKVQYEALSRFNKVGGLWDKKAGKWLEPPVIEIDFNGYKIGIRNVIRSSIQFFFYKTGNTQIKTVWAYDIAQLFEGSIEKESKNNHLNYYHKVDESAHLVDWDRYYQDNNYRVNIVNYSNGLDARAVVDLGKIIQEQFKTVFGYYPKTLISSGSLARAGIVASIFNKHNVDPTIDDSTKQENYYKAVNDIKSISFMNYYDGWLEAYGQETLKDLFAISMEAYKGALIEALIFGYVKDGYYADIASAYPSNIQKLMDLRGSKITKGDGCPPNIKNSYCYVRGIITIPKEINIHPLTVKHFSDKETNIRPVGTFKASYFLEEREYMVSLGATFENETWINIETKGELSPLALVSKELDVMRADLIAAGDTAQYAAKLVNNSGYGILYEAVANYTELNNIYSKSSINNLIQVAVSLVGNMYYDFKLKLIDIDNIAAEAVNMLSNFKNKTDISNYITTAILEHCFMVKEPHTDLKYAFEVFKSYYKNINLESIYDELEHKYDIDGCRIKSRTWGNKDGLYYDDVVSEVEHAGIVLDGNNSVDKILNMFDIYDQIKITLKLTKINIYDILDENETDAIYRDVYENIFNGLIDVNDISIENIGYRAGEFFNPIYAGWITSQTRILMSKAANSIEQQGGKVILMMTDSLMWQGKKEMLSSDVIKENKTTGYFEKPDYIKDILSLGSGRYEYSDDVGRVVNRQRGLNTTNWQSEDGIQSIDFSWHEALTNPLFHTEDKKLKVNVRSLITVGLVLNSPQRIENGEIIGYGINDLGKIITQEREVEAIIGIHKRIPLNSLTLHELTYKCVETKPLIIDSSMFGSNQVYDMTLPKLRELMMLKTCVSSKEKAAKVNRKSSRKYYNKNKTHIKKATRTKYSEIRTYGYSRDDARRMASWSSDRLMKQYIEDGMI